MARGGGGGGGEGADQPQIDTTTRARKKRCEVWGGGWSVIELVSPDTFIL